jgi:hypothetical protein
MMKKNIKKTKFKIYHYLLLSLPLVMAIAWVISIVNSQKLLITDVGLRLSPIRDSAPLLRGLFVFMGAYLVFLGVIFHENLREFFVKFKKQKQKI